MQHRVFGLDLLRTIAIVLITAIHVWSLFAMDTTLDPKVQHVYSVFFNMGNALFVLISGALLLGQVQPIATFLRKRATRVFVPFLLWSTFYYVLSVLLHKYPEIDSTTDALRSFFPYLLENKVNMLFWFVHMLVVLYLLTPLLQRILTDKKNMQYALLLYIVYLLVRDFYPSLYIFQLIDSKIGVYVGLFVAGRYIYTTPFRHSRQYYLLGFILFMILHIIIMWFGKPLTLIGVLQVCCLFGSIAPSEQPKNQHCRVWISRISRYSFLTYFLHVLVINLLLFVLPKGHIPPIATAFAIVVLCTAIGYVVDQLPDKYKHLIGI